MVFSDDEDPYFATIRPGLDGGLSGPDAYKVVPEWGVRRAEGALTKVRIMADGAFVKVYMTESRVANAPNAKIGRSKRIRFRVTAEQEAPVLFANVRMPPGARGSLSRAERRRPRDGGRNSVRYGFRPYPARVRCRIELRSQRC